MADAKEAWLKKMVGILGGSDSDDATDSSGTSTATDTKPSGGGSNGAPSSGSNGAPGSSSGAAPDDGADPKSGGPTTKDDAPSGAPTGGGGGGGGGTGGGTPKGAAGGKPAAGGGKPAGDPAAGGSTAADPAASSGTPASSGGTAKPAADDGKPSGNYESAKAAADTAQSFLKGVDTLTGPAKPLEEGIKKSSDDAAAGKKAIETAEQSAGAAEKSFPPDPKVPVPTGDNPQAQYDSAIQIKGETLKVQQDAQAKADTVGEQRDIAEEHNSKIENARKLVANSSEKISQLAATAEYSVKGAVGAANDAKALAAESKKKADQAAKDKTEDAEKLSTAAKEDAQFAAAAQEAASKAQAAGKQLETSAKNAAAELQKLEQLSTESKVAFEARKKQATDATSKLKPFFEAAGKAEAQEQEYKQKLSPEDAEAVLRKRYEALGGDSELRKALEEEDKAFETEGEKYRAKAKKWHDDTIRQLDVFKSQLDTDLQSVEQTTPKWAEWVKKEEPTGQKVTTDLNALGKKLETEPGKELAYQVSQLTDEVARMKQFNEKDVKLLEQLKATKKALDDRYRAADMQFSATKQSITDARTELNNELQMEEMSLETKVAFLQYRPKTARDRYQKQLENDIKRLVRENTDNMKSEITEFDPSVEPYVSGPLDWQPVQDKITKYQTMSLEDLQKSDPDMAAMAEKYEKAGGDEALFQKRLASWKESVASHEQIEQEYSEEQRKLSEKMRADLDTSAQREKESHDVVKQFKELQAQNQKRFDELKKKVDSSSTGLASLSDQEQAEYRLLENSIKNVGKRIDNLAGEETMRNFSKHAASALIEQQRKLYGQQRSGIQTQRPKPTSDEIVKLPLKEKYAQLVGGSA